MRAHFIARLSRHRFLWVISGLLPLLLFALIMLWLFSVEQEKSIRRLLQDAAISAAHVIDRSVGEQISLLNGMATSQALDNGNFSAFRIDAQRIWRLHPEWRTVILTDAHQPVLNLWFPVGHAIPALKDPESLIQVWNSRKSYVGNLAYGYVAIRVPVIRHDQVTYTLTAPTNPDFFQKALLASSEVKQWEFILVGSDNVVITTSKEAPVKRGELLPQSFLKKAQSDIADRYRRYAAPISISFSGWRIFIYTSARVIEAPYIQKRSIVALGAFLSAVMTLVFIGILSSAWAARRETFNLRKEIEARNQAQNALVESEKNYRSLLNSIRDAILVTNPSGTVLSCNPAFVDLFGYTLKEISGSKDAILYENEEKFNRLSHTLKQHLADRGFLTTLSFKKKNGVVFSGEANFFNLYDADHQQLGFIVLIRDITRRLETEAALRESEERFHSLVENAPDAIFVQTDGLFAYLNDAAAQFFGAQHTDDLIGQPVIDRFHPDYRNLVRERIRLLNQERKKVSRILEVCLKMDGTPVDTEVSAVPFEYGGKNGALVFMRDITESQRAHARHEALVRQLHQAQKMEAVGRLAGGVAHDFNNLLSIMLGYCEMVMEEMRPGHPHREPLQQVYSAAIRARDLTRQLLAFSRKQVLEIKIVDVNEVVLGFEKFIRRLIGEDITLKISLEQAPLFVKADTGQMEQVLMNLAVNARDAMPDGGTLTVETTLKALDDTYMDKKLTVKPGSYAMISVSDTGCGIASEFLAQIFEPFFTTKEKEKGTGLGLATSYGIIRQHGGHIWVYSEPREGTTFKIYLPLSPQPAPVKNKSILQNRPARPATRVLVIEDDTAVRKLTCDILKKAGYDVFQFGHPRRAIESAMAQKSPIHLVLTDVVMPEMKGPEVFEKLRQFHPKAEVLFMSGYTDNVVVDQGIMIEGGAFLQKPFTAKTLLDKVHQILKED